MDDGLRKEASYPPPLLSPHSFMEIWDKFAEFLDQIYL